ncbi:hypothetical protein RFI_17078, partial [Reticulomyxa filosa]
GFENQSLTQKSMTLTFDDELRSQNQPEKKTVEEVKEMPALPDFSAGTGEVLQVPKKEHKTLTSQIISNVGKGIVEIGNMNRRAFGLVFSTVDTVQEGVKELNTAIKEVGTRTMSTFTKNIDTIETGENM